MAVVHKIGELVDQCERYVIRCLAERLPDTWHVYHNLEFTPSPGRGHPYEYDAILIGPPDVWVLEIKGYSGRITGNASQLQLPNGRYEPNPIPSTNNKARILKSNLVRYDPRLAKKGIFELYVDARIIFCREAQIEINDPQSNRMHHIPDFISFLRREPAHVYAEERTQIVRDFLQLRFAPLIPNKQIGEYIIRDSISHRSKHSVTYPARHVLMRVRNRVSLKIFRFDTTLSAKGLENRKKLFVRNADVLSLLGEFPHRNIARCFPPFPWESDKIVLPLEWIDGPTLKDWLQTQEDQSFKQRLYIFRQVCQGLEHAHNLGVIHRALSPQNIVILPNNSVKLVNFDFAKLDPSLFTTTFPGETMAHHLVQHADWRYVAPELRDVNQVVNPAADVFSAGIIFFELMANRHPFNGSMKEKSVLPQPTHYNADLPIECDNLFQQMCRFNPDERLQSMTAVLRQVTLLKQL
ncbi:MAG: protein kinase [Anaerolineales bacterium]|nr:protein kinase [Anaerolineales bacterium]